MKEVLNRLFIKIVIQLHAVSRTQQGRQREPSVKTLRSPLSAEFWRHYVLSGRTLHLLEWGSNPQPVGFTVTPRAAAPRLASQDFDDLSK